MITSNGKAVISRYLGGQVGQIAGAIALGVGSTAAIISDVRLQYEVTRLPITSVAADLTNNRLVFKSSLQPGAINTIYEIGLYATGNITPGYLNLPLLGAIPGTWTNGTLTNVNARANMQALKIDFVANGTTNAEIAGFRTDASGFTDLDYIVVGFQATSNLSSVAIRLGTDSSNYYQFTLASPTVGYNIYRVARSTGVKTGSPAWNALTYAAVRPSATAGGSGSIYFDGLRFETNSLNDTNLLVARNVLTTPKVVDPDVTTDIEYSLGINIT